VRREKRSAERGTTKVGVIVLAIGTGVVVAAVVGIIGANWRTVGVSLVLAVLMTRTVVVATHRHGGRPRANGERRIAAEHGNPRTVLGATEGYHVTSK
jgi:uncharacterized membrane protein